MVTYPPRSFSPAVNYSLLHPKTKHENFNFSTFKPVCAILGLVSEVEFMEVYTLTLFLTGCTGFLGKKLVHNLLETTDHTLFVLVRDMARGTRMVTSLGQEADRRITLLKGDITKPFCGLADEMITELNGKIELFYHVAALVKFDEDLREELFAVNYEGTKHALELATNWHAKKFIYVSTAYTIGTREQGIEELYPIDDNVHNPYEESKVKSEHLVFSYANQLDVSIFRPSIIVGDSKTGEADSAFTLYGFLRALDVFKKRVERKEKDQTTIYKLIGSKYSTSNVVPVDYVADILALAVTKAEAGKIYNITNPAPFTNFHFLTLIKESLKFDRLDIVEYAAPGTLSPEEEYVNGMIKIINSYLSRSFDFDDRNTQHLIEGTDIKHLELTEETMKMIIEAYFN
jgi:nucleoside-diphosphate-sugar epimerase